MTTARILWSIAQCATAIALASFITTHRTSSDGDTGYCGKGKTLTTVQNSDGVYEVVCVSTGAGR